MGKIMGFVLNTITLATGAGGTSVSSFDLRFRNIIQVSREGMVFDIIKVGGLTAPSGTRQVNYNSAFGRLFFQVDTVFNPGETVTVKYKT